MKQWERQERDVARRRGGRMTKASGAVPGHKGDVREQTILMEMKATEKGSLSIKGAWLDKVERESGARMAAVHLEIGKDKAGRPRRWVMIPEHEFDEAFPPQETGDDGIIRT